MFLQFSLGASDVVAALHGAAGSGAFAETAHLSAGVIFLSQAALEVVFTVEIFAFGSISLSSLTPSTAWPTWAWSGSTESF